MTGDGNCQFRAIAHLLYGDAEQHSRVREEVVNHILNNDTANMNNLTLGFDISQSAPLLVNNGRKAFFPSPPRMTFFESPST